MRASPWSGLAALLALAACGPQGSDPLARQPASADADGDGVADAYDCAPRDPSAWRARSLFPDRDGDGHGAGAALALCLGDTDPAGWSPAGGDCDDADPAAYQRWEGYVDADGDGIGAGPWLSYCGGAVPSPRVAPVAGDCAPDDATRWRELPYLHRDEDGDGVTVPREGVVCTGAALPAGYAVEPAGVDCDDADRLAWAAASGYADVDRDGSGAGDPVTLCTDGALPAGYAEVAGDCAPSDPLAFASWTYAYRDADGDGRAVAQGGTLCVGRDGPPAGYLAVAPPYPPDCDDANRDLWEARSGVADADRDGHGAGPTVAVCSGAALPDGWVAPGGEPDCAPEDRLAWRSWSYAYRDADGDSYTVASSGTLCLGAAIPAGYANAASGNDCDDADALVWASVTGFADPDHDGAGSGPAIVSCTAGALPDGQVAAATDCAPEDGSRWRLLAYQLADADADGYTVPVAAGQACSGTALPDPWRATATGRDCDDADRSVWRALVRYRDGDGDGVGATPRTIFCVAADEPAGYSRFGWDVDDADPAATWDGSDQDLLLELL